MVEINLWEIKNGKSEFENAKLILSILASKEKETDIQLHYKKPESFDKTQDK